MSEEGEGGLNTQGQKLAVTVQSRVTPVLPARRRYYRGGGVQNQNSTDIGSTDTGSVVPTPWLKLASEAISVYRPYAGTTEGRSPVVPTRRRYNRPRQRIWEKKSICARANSQLFSLTWITF
jgi:hypothetical protein